MLGVIKVLHLVSLLLAVRLCFAETGELKFLFIGNMAFRISDGTNTLFTDFPYTSGAFGYMKYEPSEIVEVPNAVCLITHAHADHWNADLFQKMKASLIAPPSILKNTSSTKKVPFADHMKYGNITVDAIRTPHGAEHYSYIVTWHGVRLFFSGDTEDPSALLQAKNLDVAFISPWLLRTMENSAKTIPSKKVVIYHHDDEEEVPAYQDRLVPKQGDTFALKFDDLPA
jgi:L-ascorbate metabolism protein UlaG (beta-lactamase superfamily)